MPTNFSEYCSYRGVTCDSNNQSSTYHQVVDIEFYFPNGDDGLQPQGPLPNSIGDLTALQRLNLYKAGEGGTIPSSIGNLKALTYLHMQWNYFTGTIPSSIGYLTNLQTLWMQISELTGTIPSSIGYLTALQELFLHYNQLTGTVPSSFSKLTNLKSLLLYDNYLTAGPSGVLSEDTFSNTTGVAIYRNCLQFGGDVGTNCKRKFESVMTLNYCIQTIFTADCLHLWHSNSRHIIPNDFSVRVSIDLLS